MKLSFTHISIRLIFSIVLFTSLQATEVQDITIHKKSNGTLLRIVTSNVMEIENLAGWVGRENWFYVTLNAAYLNPAVMDYLTFEPPVIDLDVTGNNESVQLGILFDVPIGDFEIFHSDASRVILIQVWKALSDSVRSEVQISEDNNSNRVFTLPKTEAKGSPFYDSFVYARDKYGPEKYFVWYNKWYSTEDLEGEDEEIIEQEPQPLIVKDVPDVEKGSTPVILKKVSIRKIDISNILGRGMLHSGINRPTEIKALQNALVRLGYDLGTGGVFRNGVDGEFGPTTENAVRQFQTDRGYSGPNVDGVVGTTTLNEMIYALHGVPLVAVETQLGRVQTKREIRKLDNLQEINLLLPDFSKRQTFLKISCNLNGANVFVDGSLMGQTPISKNMAVKPGWHRIRVVNPEPNLSPFSISVPDYQDIYVPQGRTQHIRINLATAIQDTTE